MSSPSDQVADQPSALPRRTVLRAAVLSGAGLTGALTACGSGSGSGAAPVGSPGPAASSAPARSGAPGATTVSPQSVPGDSAASSAAAVDRPALIDASRVPQGGGVVLADQKIVVTQPTPGQFRAFGAVCTHQGCLVSDVAEAAIVCYCHGSMFSIEDGSVINPPAREPLPAVAVSLLEGTVVRG